MNLTLLGRDVAIASHARQLQESVGSNKRLFPAAKLTQTLSFLEKTMWTKPEFTEMRFGFEVTMYIANR